MNKVNPLHIIVLLIVVVLFLFVQIHTVKKELQEETTSLQKAQNVALKTLAYKTMYGNKQNTKDALERTFKQLHVKNVNLNRNANGVKIVASSLTLLTLNSLMSKIFNRAYKIKNLQITRVDENHASLVLEIVW